MKNCVIVILPSYHEGLPMSVLEDMACGKAMISSTMDKYGHSTDEQKLSSMQKLDGLYAGVSARYRR